MERETERGYKEKKYVTIPLPSWNLSYPSLVINTFPLRSRFSLPMTQAVRTSGVCFRVFVGVQEFGFLLLTAVIRNRAYYWKLKIFTQVIYDVLIKLYLVIKIGNTI